jgi:PAB-dependent poly(A)-specific ribonuclease subunit 2
MEADWDEITRVTVPPPGPHAVPATASCVIAFDDAQELLWTGNEYVGEYPPLIFDC